MEKKAHESFDDGMIRNEMLDEAAKLFSENYGVWSEQTAQMMGSFAKAGRYAIMSIKNQTHRYLGTRVRLSKEWFRNGYLLRGLYSYIRLFVNDQLAGNAFACRWSLEGRTVCWTTTISCAPSLPFAWACNWDLSEVMKDGDDIYGITSSHPAACLAASCA